MQAGQAKAKAPAPSGTVSVVFPPKNAASKIVIDKVAIGTSSTVEFTNNTGDMVRLWIPRGASLFNRPSPGQDFNDLVIKNGDSLKLSVLGTPTNGTYPYHVFCKSIDDYARGGSVPNMSCP